jgi:citrate synthase
MSDPSTDGLMTTAEVARRLGVRRETVYAYVSRGLLARDPASGHRRSLFRPEDVEALADRARHGNSSGALEVTIRSELTSLDPAGRLFYRGRDAVELARHRSFEAIAGLLWEGEADGPWRLRAADRKLLASVRSTLPDNAPASDLIAVAVATLGATDPSASDRRPEAVRRAARRMGAGATAILGGDTGTLGTTAERLWRALSKRRRRPPPRQVAAVDAALVLLADHELSASALAARIAASTWADPYRVVLAGLAPLGGALHGAVSLAVADLLDGLDSPDQAFTAVERRVATGPAPGFLPGFGHGVYRDRDPRAEHLLDRVPAVTTDPARAQIVRAVAHAAHELGLPRPNADFGLAALTYAMEMRHDAAIAIFSVARIAGLIAHALEEYPHRLRFRPRASYVGTAPAG